ncbi:MAG: serine/threonine-protein kinase [Dehalococcoidia bacterium]
MQTEIGSQIGRFKLLSLLGTGGFATVYRAEDTQLGREVALKLLHPHLARDEGFVRRFRAEARAAARLRHPHIVTVYEVGETADGRAFLIMALLEGTLLSTIIAGQAPLPLQEASPIVTQLASALDYLHSQRLVHRDLKPANVMVASDGNVTLMDFGIARAVDDQTQLTATGQMVGTPVYMAPEQISNDAVGPRADIYALGVLTYEMLAGKPPFRGSVTSVIADQLNKAPPPISEFSPTLPSQVWKALQICLAKYPSDRPATATIFVSLLLGEHSLDELPTESLPNSGHLEDAEETLAYVSGPTSRGAVQRGAGTTTDRPVGTVSSPSAVRRVSLRMAAAAVLAVSLVAASLLWFLLLRSSRGSEGMLVVASDPSGAAVTVDGKAQGLTPLSPLKLSSGLHTLNLEKATYRTLRRDEKIRANQTDSVTVPLVSLPASVLLKLVPEQTYIARGVIKDGSGSLQRGASVLQVKVEEQFTFVVTLLQSTPGIRDIPFQYRFQIIDPNGNSVDSMAGGLTIAKNDQQGKSLFWPHAFPATTSIPGAYRIDFLIVQRDGDQELTSQSVVLLP